jgi:hypothetical protein
MEKQRLEKQRWEEPGKRKEERKAEKESQKQEDASARKGRKVAGHCVFSNVLWPLWAEN